MKMYIKILVRESKQKTDTVTLTVLGYEKAWDTYKQLAETMCGLADVELIDGETCEIIESTFEDEEQCGFPHYFFVWAGGEWPAFAELFDYTRPRTFCQGKSAKILHKVYPKILCTLHNGKSLTTL